MIVDEPGFWLAVFQIIWIDVLLSGDNAVVIALACRKLPPKQRLWGVVLGTMVAITLRVVFAGAITALMKMPYRPCGVNRPNRWPKKRNRIPAWNRLLPQRRLPLRSICDESLFQLYWFWSKRIRLPTRNTVKQT